MADETKKLAAFGAGIDLKSVPETVVAHARLLVLDSLAIAIRARHEVDSTAPLMAALADGGLDQGNSTVPGDSERYGVLGAALAGGTLIHSLDFDDTHAASSLHPSAPVIPAALAVGEAAGASGADVLAGIIAGYEAICRLGLAVDPADHYARGFHPSATCGAFGAALAAGRVLALTPDQMEHALGIALSQASGSMQYLANGAWTKRFQVGHAAMAGAQAALLARRGFTGASDAIEGRHGFFKGYAPDADAKRAADRLGSHWETAAIAVKPYPSCRYTHACVDAAQALMAENGLSVDDIESVTAGLPQSGMELTGIPEERKRAPKNIVDGQFSVHFCVAVMLRQGRFGWDDYAVHLADPDTLALTARIKAVQDPRAQEAAPEYMAGSLTLGLRDGRTFDKFVKICRGEPEAPLTPDEIREKTASLVMPILGEDREAAFFHAIMRFEKSDLPAIMAAVRPEKTASDSPSGAQD
ncbi:MmgE/PrpD family protein [Fodinicurvata sp. EGI_FJ10296]|uniref:MmgE/PrpD family protein n=1 Tax=Fodinicurvata sp. EGI_FJ10296 TaxID=3231908 RepID=UPI00345452CE